MPRANIRLLLASVAVVVLASVLAARVQNSGGRVSVHDIKIPTQNGQWVVADLFRPKTATSETPAPLVVVIPGVSRSADCLFDLCDDPAVEHRVLPAALGLASVDPGDLLDDVEQDVRARDHLAGFGELEDVVADAAATRHEDHSRGAMRREHLGVVAGP